METRNIGKQTRCFRRASQFAVFAPRDAKIVIIRVQLNLSAGAPLRILQIRDNCFLPPA